MRPKIMFVVSLALAVSAVGFLVHNRGQAEGTDASISADGGAAIEESASAGQYGAGGAVARSGGPVIPANFYFTKLVNSVIFSHQTHVVDKGNQCGTCHSGLFQMKAGTAENSSDFNMGGLSKGKYCGTCHSSSSNVAFAAGTQCARCHRGVKGLDSGAVAGGRSAVAGGSGAVAGGGEDDASGESSPPQSGESSSPQDG